MDDFPVSYRPVTRRWCNLTRLNGAELYVLIAGTLGILITIAMSIFTIVVSNDIEDKYFSCITIFCSVMTLLYLHRGIFWERAYELLIYVISAVCLMCYVIINYTQTFKKYSSWDKIFITKLIKLISSLIIAPSTSVVGAILAYKYHIYGDLIFRTVGSFEQLQDACKKLFAFEAVLALDFQFEIILVLLILGSNAITQNTILGIGLTFSIVWIIVGLFSMRSENKVLSLLFFIFGLLEPCYIIYLLEKSIRNIISQKNSTVEMENKIDIDYVTLSCCLLALIVRGLLFGVGYGVYKNFNSGLKNRINYWFKSQVTSYSTFDSS